MVVVLGPHHHEIYGPLRMKRAKKHRAARTQGGNAIRNNAYSGTCFNIGEDGSDDAGGVDDSWGKTSAATGLQDRIVQTDAFPPGKHNERLEGELAPEQGSF